MSAEDAERQKNMLETIGADRYARSLRHAVELCIDAAQDSVVASDKTPSMVAEQSAVAV
jgi:hypothetical protein